MPSPVTGEGNATQAPNISDGQGTVGTGHGASVSLSVNAGVASASASAHDPSAQAVDLQVDDLVSRTTISQVPADANAITDSATLDLSSDSADEPPWACRVHPWSQSRLVPRDDDEIRVEDAFGRSQMNGVVGPQRGLLCGSVDEVVIGVDDFELGEDHGELAPGRVTSTGGLRGSPMPMPLSRERWCAS